MKVIKSFSTEEKENSKFDNNLDLLFKTEKKIIYTCNFVIKFLLIL